MFLIRNVAQCRTLISFRFQSLQMNAIGRGIPAFSEKKKKNCTIGKSYSFVLYCIIGAIPIIACLHGKLYNINIYIYIYVHAYINSRFHFSLVIYGPHITQFPLLVPEYSWHCISYLLEKKKIWNAQSLTTFIPWEKIEGLLISQPANVLSCSSLSFFRIVCICTWTGTETERYFHFLSQIGLIDYSFLFYNVCS